VQSIFYYIVQRHDLFHIGHGLILVSIFLFFFYGLVSVHSKQFNNFLYLLLPLCLFTIVLKVLWTGGYFSSFLIWIVLIPFTLNLIFRSRFFIFFSILNIFCALGSLLYFIQLEQFKFVHVLFKLSGFNLLMLYTIPFTFLIVIYVNIKDSLDKGKVLFKYFAEDSTVKGISAYLEAFKIMFLKIEQLSETRFLIQTNDQVEKLESCLALVDIKISNYSVQSEYCEYIIE
jgi:hypothetical protein